MAYGYKRVVVETRYTLNIGESTVTLYVRPGGVYTSTRQNYDRILEQSAAELRRRWNDVHDGYDDDETKMYRASFIALPHHARAAMVAEWEPTN